ncbi:outer membrane protein assembly factor BamB family protein [Tuwongella immobilis]|uniref:outer membrane protein assembly factor BamB family protein n=1 Tax=Tuwongella immobilis TaxID=692036 RepID=UPI0018D5E340|nr:PQQ-binding-like beta-propeller repeat protein [Tuwongella immobilis]
MFAENWPQWRGAANDGISDEKGLPTEWSETKNIAWKLKMPGMGASTPAIWGDSLFVTSIAPDLTLSLICVGTDGKERWTRELGKGSGKVARSDEGNEASPSPSTDGKAVYVFVGSGDLAAFDFEGKKLWAVNLQKMYGKFDIQFGMHSTPVLYENHLYLQLIHSNGAWVIALDKSSGKEVWKVKRESDGRAECEHSYASPVLWKRGDSAYLITHGNDYAIAHDLKDGHEIWRVGDLNLKSKYNPTLRFVASPLATSDLIIVPSAKNGPVVAVKPNAKGLVMRGSEHQQWRLDSGTPDVPSPVISKGLVYLARENGGLICLDAASGEQYYAERTHNARHRANPLVADGKIYLVARDGLTTVVKEGRSFEVLSKNQLKDQIAASPAVHNGRIYLRGYDYLYAISEGGK